MKIQVLYFARLRELRGREHETLESHQSTCSQLYDELSMRFRFEMTRDVVSVAVNETLTSWDTVLHDDDTVAFLPPVSGG